MIQAFVPIWPPIPRVGYRFAKFFPKGLAQFFTLFEKKQMKNWLRTLIAGYAGWKWGGGCLGFIVVFAIVYFLLGNVHC